MTAVCDAAQHGLHRYDQDRSAGPCEPKPVLTGTLGAWSVLAGAIESAKAVVHENRLPRLRAARGDVHVCGLQFQDGRLSPNDSVPAFK